MREQRTLRVAEPKRASAIATYLALGFSMMSCADPLEIGTHPVDDRQLSESQRLVHLQTAFEGDMTIGDMLRDIDGLRVKSAPRPDTLLRTTAEKDDDRPAAGGIPLRILVQNVALLDAQIFGFIDYAQTPFLAERRRELPGLYIDAGYDILLLQEVWVQEDLERFSQTAQDSGYAAFAGSRDEYNDGLLTLIKNDLMNTDVEADFDGVPYQMQDGTEHFPGPGIKRGYHLVRFEHATLGQISVFNTHMQPYASNWKHRMMQARQLGIAIDSHVNDNELVFVGGDLNSGPYYAADVWTHPDGRDEIGWWKNAIAYPLLLEYAELDDLAVMGRSADNATSDIVLGDAIPNLPEQALETPLGDSAFCEEVPHDTFSATDCNTLYFAQYAGTEPPARLDHLHARDPQGRIRVVGSTLAFTEMMDFSGVRTEASDHYGVDLQLVIDGDQ